MGIFNKFINRLLDTEVPPAVEQLVKKVAAEKQKLSNTELFSMTIDDVFSIVGRGTVVTGKITSGVIKLNNEVVIAGGAELRRAKVTSIEKFNKVVNEAKTGDEVGLLLDGITKNSVRKGQIVADSNHPIIETYSKTNTESPEQNVPVSKANESYKERIDSIPLIVSYAEIIPAEERIKDAIASSNGLYPHEVLVLNYAPKFYTEDNKYQKFWWDRYGIKDVDAILSSLLKKGFIQIGNLKSSLEHETLETLKKVLKTYNLKATGKKADLIQLLLDNVSEDELNGKFTKRLYQLTEMGQEETSKEEYVLYIHNHSIENLGIWSLNKMVYSEPRQNYRDKIWAYLNRHGAEHFSKGDFGLYRNCRYTMSQFLAEENKLKESLQMLAEVTFYDLCGTGNNYNPDTIDISAEYFFPYENSIATVAPGIVQEIMEYKEELEYSDEELRNIMVERISRLSAPIKLFTPDECVDIVLMEYREDTASLKKLYSEAKQKFKKEHPNIKLP